MNLLKKPILILGIVLGIFLVLIPNLSAQDSFDFSDEPTEPQPESIDNLQMAPDIPEVEPQPELVDGFQTDLDAPPDEEPPPEEVFQWPLPGKIKDFASPVEPDESIKEFSFEEEAPPSSSPRTWDMVVMPGSHARKFFNSGDFRDPFFPLRGFMGEASRSLEPGTTIDGLRFNNYGDSELFIDRYYRNSRFNLADVFGRVDRVPGQRGCLYCHRGIEEIGRNHQFKCTKCHAGNGKTRSQSKAHTGMVSNPSDLKHAEKYCGKCHADQVATVAQSVMATNKNLINMTRYAWGAQAPEDHSYSLAPIEGEKALPSVKNGHAVDGFLRGKCLRCHLNGEAPHRPGDYRSTGCAACHMIYTNSGLSMTQDRAIQRTQKQSTGNKIENRFAKKMAANPLKNKRGFPILHKFTLAIPSVQCEHCHNGNGVGNEFEGMIAKPDRPVSNGATSLDEKPVLYGSQHEFLVQDIHRERGMHCIDCHGAKDVKGASDAGHSSVEVRCEDCHGTHDKAPDEFLIDKTDPDAEDILKANMLNPNLRKKVRAGDTVMMNSRGTLLTSIKKLKEQWVLYSKVTGKKHIIPILKDKKPPVAHQVQKHMTQMECHTCHARWSAADWGMHLIREKDLDLKKWGNWQISDPNLQQLLSDGLQSPESGDAATGTIDWLTAKNITKAVVGEKMDGLWWSVVTESSWDTMILGKNARGKYSILKPRYQYFITDLRDGANKKNRARFLKTPDGKPSLLMAPYTPHTTRKKVRSCESCHESVTAVGLGEPTKFSVQDYKRFVRELKNKNRIVPEFQLKQMVVESGQALQKVYPEGEARLLNKKEIDAIAKKTDAYKAYRFMDLREQGYSRFLTRQEFPYDYQHKKMQQEFGEPQPVEDWYYDLNGNRFVSPNDVPVEMIPPVPPELSGTSQFLEQTGETSPIGKFFNDIFNDGTPEN
jgi:hypothetical protein